MSAPPIFRLVGERRVSVVRDPAAVWRVLDEDPVASCMVAARVADYGIDPNSIGGELWTLRGAEESLCFAGANLIPLRGGSIDLNAFADEAMSASRRCSSLVGRADLVLPMWRRLESAWGPARDVRDQQPLMALTNHPNCELDFDVRQVRPEELDAYLVAAVDMFIGEVGVDPRLGDGGRGYRRRVASLIAAGRAWARFEHGQVIFKAEVGSQSPSVGQIQGVWVHPEWRGMGLGTAGTATLAAVIVGSGRIASLYVNDFNSVARAAYTRVGFKSARSRPCCWTSRSASQVRPQRVNNGWVSVCRGHSPSHSS
jgi:predicted GNAT family acetyltransferase